LEIVGAVKVQTLFKKIKIESNIMLYNFNNYITKIVITLYNFISANWKRKFALNEEKKKLAACWARQCGWMDGWKGGWWEYRNSGPNRAGQASDFNTWIGSSFKTTSSSVFCLWRISPTGQPELVFFVGFVLLLLIADAFIQSTST
jgi:hypothetical protein